MKTSLITIMLAFVALAGIAQTKPVKQQPKLQPEKHYVIQLNQTELQQLFALVNMAKNLVPYSKQKAEDKVSTIQFIDEYAEKLTGYVKDAAIDSISKH